jgi:hypothetical protein
MRWLKMGINDAEMKKEQQWDRRREREREKEIDS